MRQAAQKITSAEIRHFSPMNKMSDDDAQELLRTAITTQLSAGTKIFSPDDDDKRVFYLIKGEIEVTTRKKEKAIINVGSVGQPRDKDNRASYVYIQDSEVHYVRLEYDYETAAKKIYETQQLDNFEGDRLFEGR